MAENSPKDEQKPEQTPPTPPSGDTPKAAVAELRSQVAVLEGELATLKAELATRDRDLEAARSEIAVLKSRFQQAGKSTLPDLGKDAKELTESVTFVDKGKRVAAKAGDVVTLKGAEELQRKLGKLATVHSISAETAKELQERGFVR